MTQYFRTAVHYEDVSDINPCRLKPCLCCPARRRPLGIRQGCAAIVASIALTEASIAHILNAEGEKIQRVLEVSQCPCRYLAVNETVRATIRELTELERLLCDKLEKVGTFYREIS
jgi:hypothetical protein